MPSECVVTNNLKQVRLIFSSSCLSGAILITEHLSFFK